MKLTGENNVVKLFLSDLNTKRSSPHTIVSYTYILRLLVSVLETVCGVTELERVTVIHLRQCVEHLLTNSLSSGKRLPDNGKTFSASTVRNHIKVWKTFFTWCFQEELLDKNPVLRLSSPRADRRIIPAFSDEQVAKMLACFDLSTDIGFRDYLILLLLLDTGIRLSEIAGLDVVSVQDGYIKVFGKGRKEREVGVHPDVSKLLWKYIHKYRKPKHEDEPALFLSSSHKSAGSRIGMGGVKHIIERVKAVTGITDMRVSPHVFRHTFAKMYLKAGGDVFSLSREMGHSSTQTTNIYLQDFNSSDARRQHTTFSPINNIKLRKKQKRVEKQE
jgi:integrase/recombinase XerD